MKTCRLCGIETSHEEGIYCNRCANLLYGLDSGDITEHLLKRIEKLEATSNMLARSLVAVINNPAEFKAKVEAEFQRRAKEK